MAGPSDDSTNATVVDAPAPAEWTPEMESLVAMHRAVAVRTLRAGDAHTAFTDLVRSTRSVPMRASLAALVTRLALASNQIAPAVTVLTQGLDETEGEDRRGVMRALIRLVRKAKNTERAREMLVQLLAEQTDDRRARFVLNELLERDSRWDELDASLEKETRLALRRNSFRVASRVALRRARLWGERLNDPARAALRYGQAAQFAEQSREFQTAFLLRLLQVNSLHRSQAAARAIEETVSLTLTLGERIGKAPRAREFFKQLGVLPAPPTLSEHKPPSANIKPRLYNLAQSTTETAIAPAPTRPPSKPAAAAVAPAAPTHSSPTVEMPIAAPAEPSKPSSAQAELLAAVDELAPSARAPAVAAVLAAAVDEGPDPLPAKKLEAHYIARGAWTELADFYRRTVKRAKSRTEQAAWAEKLAELLESELNDPAGAAEAWSGVVAATGDPRAVAQQVRLLNEQRDFSGVREALNAGVASAADATERAQAHVLRAEEAQARQHYTQARADFERALSLVPRLPRAAAGLAEVAAAQNDVAPVRAFERVLAALPKGAPGRAGLFRRLGRLADHAVHDPKLSRLAWSEVAAAAPADEEASSRLLALARATDDDALLESQLRGVLARVTHGDAARHARMELVAVLERSGRADDALAALRDFVHVEPGHQEAWVALADRCIAKGLDDDGVWALEQAALATEPVKERLSLYQRLTRLARERLYDDERADAFAAKADVLKASLEPAAPLLGGPVMLPRPKVPLAAPVVRESDFEETAAVLESRLEPDEDARVKAHVRHPARLVPLLKSFVNEADFQELTHGLDDHGDDEVVELGTSDIALPDDEEDRTGEAISEETATVTPAGAPRRQTLEVPVTDHVSLEALPFSHSASKALKEEREALLAQLDEGPLEAESYRQLAEHFDTASDAGRSSLMLEIARALDGDPNAAPRTPRLILSEADRLALKHPSLRGEAGELLSAVGSALCRLAPAKGRDAGSEDEFRLDGGKGAKATADALLSAVRILGVRAPDVHLSEDAGPPFAVVFVDAPRVLVGRVAVKKPSPAAELRFYAGRALFTLSPELMALRSIRRDDLMRGLHIVSQVLQGKASALHSRLVVNDLSPQVWERLKTLFLTQLRTLDLNALAEGARHSANRAGLVVCGGVAPALEALRAKKALESEVIELVRFAASDVYLELRGRTLARR